MAKADVAKSVGPNVKANERSMAASSLVLFSQGGWLRRVAVAGAIVKAAGETACAGSAR